PVHWQGVDAGALLGVPVLLAAVGLFALRQRFMQRLQVLHGQVGRLRFDSQGHTPRAIALNYLLALPGPLLLLSVGLALQHGAAGSGRAVGTMLVHVSLAWNVIAWSRRLLIPDGVAIRHFHWPEGYAKQL